MPLFLPAASPTKRGLDIVLSLVLLALLAPLLGLVGLAVRLTSPGPVLFRQRRIGHQCNVFEMLKFRTMVEGAEGMEAELDDRVEGDTFFKLRDDPRVTPLGHFLRRTSLDELPQLLNVLWGEMSLVGPRPLLLADFEKFPRNEQMRRFAARPGITGLWQVSGRSETSDGDRMNLDLAYVDGWSHTLDLRILALTLPAVLRAEGAV